MMIILFFQIYYSFKISNPSRKKNMKKFFQKSYIILQKNFYMAINFFQN